MMPYLSRIKAVSSRTVRNARLGKVRNPDLPARDDQEAIWRGHYPAATLFRLSAA